MFRYYMYQLKKLDKDSRVRPSADVIPCLGPSPRRCVPPPSRCLPWDLPRLPAAPLSSTWIEPRTDSQFCPPPPSPARKPVLADSDSRVPVVRRELLPVASRSTLCTEHYVVLLRGRCGAPHTLPKRLASDRAHTPPSHDPSDGNDTHSLHPLSWGGRWRRA